MEDIPNIVEQAKRGFPHIAFTVAPHLGVSEKMLVLLAASASNAL